MGGDIGCYAVEAIGWCRLSQGRSGGRDRDTIGAALALGVRAATVTVSRAGANPPWLNEL